MPHLPTVDKGDADPDIAFPPVTKDHILNCSYDAWFPKYRNSCLKSRIVNLPPEFVSYLLEDGIILTDNDGEGGAEDEEWHSAGAFTTRPRVQEIDSSDDEDEDGENSPGRSERLPPNKRFPTTHREIIEKIAELGGAVAPKLNWSSPKDAKWISPHQNTLKCTSPDDIYLLLKSSSFVSHDLVHAFDGCTDAAPTRPFRPVLVLRPFFTPHVALEFRCFVKHRSLVAISQRDLNYYDFLSGLRSALTSKIDAFFQDTLRLTFPDSSFTFDVYVPESHFADDGLGKVRLIDINPWAARTDSLLFDWQELLAWDVVKPLYGSASRREEAADESADDSLASGTEDDDGAGAGAGVGGPELRLIEKDDPAAFNFSSAQYSAHKLPKEVVDASLAGEGGIVEFARQWKEMTEGKGGDIWEQTGALNR